MGGPGKTAPLLLRDLLTYDPRPRQADKADRNLLTSLPPHYDPRASPTPAVPAGNCRHDLQLKEEQSALPQKGVDPGHLRVYRVASFCKECRCHFDLVVDFRDNDLQNSPCSKSNSDFPLHHFLFVGEEKPRTYHFSCSAPKCPAVLRIRISLPCFSEADVTLLTDPVHLQRRWKTSIEIDGERADADMARPIDAPNFLNTYLHDSLNPKQGKNRIPLLNRKFLKTFGRDCDNILKFLGFESAREQEPDGSTVEVWYLPKPSPAQEPLDSFERTTRNIIEDARYELNALILHLSGPDRSSARRAPLNFMPSRSYIELALGCDDYELRVGGRRETRSQTHEEDHPYYASLGSLADFADSLLLFAYDRQVTVDPLNTAYYFECLKDLAIGRQSLALQTQVSILESQGLVTRDEVVAAYRTLGIDPSHAHALSDEIITNQFKSRISDISPKLVPEARKALLLIGKSRDSDLIKRAASGSLETYEEALAWLDLADNSISDDDFVVSMFTAKTSDNPGEVETGRKAIQIIADYRNSQRLRQWLETGTMDKAEMDTAEAYATLNITDRSAKLDPTLLESQVSVMMADNPDNADWLRIAHEKVRQDQEMSHGKSNYLARPAVDYPLETWPVGCCNIGNTCYLNSVLQFLFTIKPLRDMVIECDEHLQDLSPEALEPKRVGRTAVSRARAETGQQFVRELQGLFRRMITAPTHNIRPERSLAALALTRGESMNISTTGSNADKDDALPGLGMIGDMPISGPMLPPNLQGSRPPTPADSLMDDAEGDADSMKAMDLTATADEPNGTASSRPEPPSRPPPVPPRPQASADLGLKKLEDVAQQQDAAEILNNVFDLLSCAFKGGFIMRDGEQGDLIKQLFFSDVTTVRRIQDKVIPKTDLQDNVLVSTKGRDRSLCAALDDEFGLTELEGGITKYEFFEEASPIQIINVRRLQFENGQARKDESHLALDKVMYMDRYLKKTNSLSEDQLQELRNQQWQLQSELRSLENRKKLLKETEFKDVDLPGVLDETACLVRELKDQSQELFELKSEPSQMPSSIYRCGSDHHLNERADELRRELSEIHERMDRLEEQIDSVFENCKDHPYRLHAIFMHAGSHSGGHYWIYIYDFQNNIWRKYNDETVTEECEENILKRVQQDRPPTSTGIVYVREDVATEYTQAVYRQPEAVRSNGNGGDVDMPDADTVLPGVVKMDDVDFNNLQVIEGQQVSQDSDEVLSNSFPPNPRSPRCHLRRDSATTSSLVQHIEYIDLGKRMASDSPDPGEMSPGKKVRFMIGTGDSMVEAVEQSSDTTEGSRQSGEISPLSGQTSDALHESTKLQYPKRVRLKLPPKPASPASPPDCC